MAAEGIANFQAVVMTLVAVTGSIIAGMGLMTWKQQIRWQQGRGLAINLLQAFFELKSILNETGRLSHFKIDDSLSDEEKSAESKAAWKRAIEHHEKMSLAFSTFQRYVAEAIVVWNEDFSEVMSELSELKHIGSNLVLTGASSVDLTRSKRERSEFASDYEDTKSDFYGIRKDRRNVGLRLAELQIKIKAKIDQQRLN